MNSGIKDKHTYFFVARKLEDIFKNKYKRREQLFYDETETFGRRIESGQSYF